MCLKRGNKKGNQRKNMKTKYEIFLQWNTRFFSSESSVCPAFRILNFLMKRTFWWKKFTYIYRASKKIPVNHHDFRAVYSWKTAMQICLTLKAPIPKNGQTHSNNSSAICRRIVWVCLTILWNWRLKG